MKAMFLTVVFLTNVLRFELAVTQDEKERGMMYRQSWGQIDGMIFVHEAPGRVYYWMKNTPLPMAMAFMDDEMRLSELYMPEPYSTTIVVSSNDRIRYVIELKPSLTNLVFGHPEILRNKLLPELRRVTQKR